MREKQCDGHSTYIKDQSQFDSFLGSEWDYVILSLVRSLSDDDLVAKPSMYWVREHLGFLADEHLMNVGLTRARKGLCIIGKKEKISQHYLFCLSPRNVHILPLLCI